MSMRSPAHPGQLLKDDLDALGWTVAAAAEALGITRQQLHRVIAGTSSVSPEMAIRLEKGLGTSADTWLRMQAAYDLAEIRRRVPGIKVRRLASKVA